MAHTPGPWTVICDRDDDDERPLEIVVSSDWNSRIAFPASDGNPDDARLIAAAPDLLAACKAQHEAIDRLFAMLIIATGSDIPSEAGMAFMPSQSGQPWDALVAGNAAIAKATGEAA